MTEEGHGFLRAVEDIVIQVPQLLERARLPGDISEPHLDRERFPVGILRRFRLARLLIHHAGLMPAHGDGARFVQLREPLARFGIRRQRLRVAALLHADGPKLAFADGDLPVVTELLAAADALFVGRRRFVEPAQVEKTVALFREADGRHPFRGFAGTLLGHGLEALAGLVQQRQGLFRAAGRLQHAGQEEASHRQIVIGVGIRLLARRPGALEQLLRALERLAQPPAGKLLLDAGPRRLEPRVIPGVAQRRRRGVAHLPHALQQPRLAEHLQQAVERSGQINRRLRIPRALHEVEQRKEVRQFQHRQRRRDFGVLALLLHEELGIRAHRLDPAGRQRLALRARPSARAGRGRARD